MKRTGLFLSIILWGTPAWAQTQVQAFRTVAFICAAGRNGTAVRTVENVRGERISYRISYLDSRATLLVISRARHGRDFRQVKAIDLRSTVGEGNVVLARRLADEMIANAARYCQGGQRQIEARYELIANHEFNRLHPGYRGK